MLAISLGKACKFRGLLCSDCNLALGILKDNQATMYRLIRYLEGA